MIQVIDRCADILEILGAESGNSVSLSELAERVGIQKSTCANILKSLEQRGYVEHDGRRAGWRLGYKAYRLVNSPAYYEHLKSICSDALQTLFEKTGETVVLAVIIDNRRVVIDRRECQQGITARIRHSGYLYLSATGRVIAAFYPERKRRMLIDRIGLPQEEDWPGIDSRERLEEEFAKIRSEGLARTSGESGIVGIAVPLFYRGSAIASIGICLPEFRLSAEVQRKIESALKEAAKTFI